MTRTKRVFTVLKGLVMIAFAVMLVFVPTKYMLNIVLGTIGIGITLKGFSILWYYLSMARSMVGGKSVLFKAIIYLDIGALTATLVDSPGASVVLYLAAINGFSGAVSILRAREAKGVGSRWKLTFAHGAVNILFAVAVIVLGFVLKMPEHAVYIYVISLLYSAVMTIISAFRRTAIVYIQ